MNNALKISLWLIGIIVILVLVYLLAPISTWKEYKERHPSLFEVKDDATPSYLNFCKSFWKSFIQVEKGNTEDLTYDGGELPEVTVLPNKPIRK